MARFIFKPILLLFLIFTANLSLALDSKFEEGVRLFGEKEFEKAEAAFSEALKADPLNTDIYFNLGLSNYNLLKTGKALAYWRRALDINPYYSEARKALRVGIKERAITPLPEEEPLSEKFRRNVLSYVSFDLFLTFFFIFFVSGLLKLVHYFGSARRALLAEQAKPALGTLTPFLLFLAIFFLSLVLLRALDYTSPRATVIERRETVRSGPSSEDASLFDLFEGHEVIVRQSRQDWVQISYPGGYTGWVKKASLIHSSGRQPW